MTSYFLSMFYTGNVAAVSEDSLTKFRTKLLQYTSCTNCRHRLSLREQGWWVTFFFCDTKFYLWNSLHSFAGRESYIKTLHQLNTAESCAYPHIPENPAIKQEQLQHTLMDIKTHEHFTPFLSLAMSHWKHIFSCPNQSRHAVQSIKWCEKTDMWIKGISIIHLYTDYSFKLTELNIAGIYDLQ